MIKLISTRMKDFRNVHLRSPLTKACALLLLASTGTYSTQALADGPKVYTNEDYISSVNQSSKLDVTKPKSVFQHVLNSLPKTVRVYPTEGYYYFYFYQDGAKYAGNIRLDIEEREKGILLFNFFKATNDWSYDDKNNFHKYGKKDGVLVEKTANLTYRVTSGKTSVVFKLNDLSAVKAPKGAVRKEEKLIGPMLDESGVRFFLVFNPKIKIFHYILDETGSSNDELIKSEVSENIVIGRRTGFAYYKDPNSDRKILFGVHNRNASVNNYFDGPFDQLPDSFIKGDDLKNAIIAVAPGLKGKIDRYGNFDGDARRFLIAPYMYYDTHQDLTPVKDCIDKKFFPSIYQCFEIPEEEEQKGPPKDKAKEQAKGDKKN